MDAQSTVLECHPISIADKQIYEVYLRESSPRGCEYSFANLFLWGEQKITYFAGHAVIFSRFGTRFLYPYPVGVGDKRAVLDAIFEDAAARGIEWRFSGVLPREKEELETLCPDTFTFAFPEGSHDYVYDINDLADLAGRKDHGKRNHCKRFETLYPDHRIDPISSANLEDVRGMAQKWYEEREEGGDGEFDLEKIAIERALANYRELELDGLVLYVGDEIVAVTMGNRMTEDTVDVNFEKALSGFDGAYAYINRTFARYLREKYPDVRFLNREEDMGIEGLRRAKQSYYPHHRVEKYRAIPKETAYEI